MASGWGLRPGIALTAEQMAQLTSDIVWLVEQTITLADGSTTTALVPQVYLRVQPGDLADNGALLAGANVDLKLRGDFVNEGDVAGRKLVSIDAGNIRNLAGANISGQQVGLQAKQDIDIIGSTVTATDALSVKAGGNITVASTTRSWENSGSHAQSSTSIDRVAGLYVTSPSGIGALTVNAGGDVTLTGAQVINAGVNGATVLAAGGNLNLDTIAQKQSLDLTTDSRNYVRNSQTTHVGSTVSGAGNVVLQAGNDVNLNAANVNAGNAIAVQAGRDINSSVAVDVSTVDTSYAGKKASGAVSASDETVRGTQITAGGDIAMQAGRDVTLQATTVASDEGDIGVSAGRDVNLTAAQEQHDLTIDEQRKKKGALSSKTTTTHDEWHDSIAVTTTLSGETVTVAAGRDLTSQGAQIAGTGDVVLAAGRDLTLGTAESTSTEVHDKTVTKSGLFGSGGIGFTVGKQRTDTEADSTGVSHTGSTVGSLSGDVTLLAGNALKIEGSDVIALQGDVTGKAKSISIAEVYDTTTAEQQTRFKQAGLTVAVSAPALSLLQTANDLNKAAKQSGGDGRMQALAAGTAALNAYNSAGAMGQLADGLASGNPADMAKGANVSISATIGASKSSSQSTQSSSQAKGSSLQAGGDVSLIATGGGEDSNILIRGSDITAGKDVLLAADNNITLEAAQNTAEQHSSSKSSSWALGVAASYGSDGGAIGVTASASASRGNADGKDVTQRNTHVTTGNTATVISGGDTTLKGAQLSADKVVANIGGDLNIESLQDTSTYDSKNKSMGASVTVGAGFSGSASYSSSNVDGDYASVTEQSGIQAGAGGFDITVAGNTDLKGAVIASSQEAIDAGLNRLQTGTLTSSDIENHSQYNAKSVSLSGGYSVAGEGGGTEGSPSTTNNGSNWSWQNYNTGAQGAAAGYGSEKGKESSTTASGISGGTVVITDQAGQQALTGKTAEEALAALNREVLTGDGANGLAKAWDGQKLQQQVEAQAQITAMFGQQAGKAVGDYASSKARELRLQGDEEEAAKWDEGGAYRVAAHTLMGALGGGVDGALGSGSTALAAPYIANLTSNLPEGVKAAVGVGLAAGLGSLLAGSTGAAMGVNQDVNNRQLHPDELNFLADKAKEFADIIYGCGEQCSSNQIKDARGRLIREAYSRVDSIGSSPDAYDEVAEAFINNNPVDFAWGKGFYATRDQYIDTSYFKDFLASDVKAFDYLTGALADGGATREYLQAAYRNVLSDLADASRGRDGVEILETFSGDIGMALGIVRKVATGDSEGAAIDAVIAAVPWKIGKLFRPLAVATDGTYWLNGRVIDAAWVNAKGELTWINPINGVKEVFPDAAKVNVDHILPRAYFPTIDGFTSLPKRVQDELIDSIDNLQPMVKPANCSKSCLVEFVDGGWKTWDGRAVSPQYKNYLLQVQSAVREKVAKAVEKFNVD